MPGTLPDVQPQERTPAMNLRNYRPGQAGGHEVGIKRFLTGEQFTGIILPTRYGKTDVIRNISWELFTGKQACISLVIEPNEVLRDQVLSPDRIAGWMSRYDIEGTVPRYQVLERLPKGRLANGEFLATTTMQL